MLIRLMNPNMFENLLVLLGLGLRVDILAKAMVKDAELVFLNLRDKKNQYYIGNKKIESIVHWFCHHFLFLNFNLLLKHNGINT